MNGSPSPAHFHEIIQLVDPEALFTGDLAQPLPFQSRDRFIIILWTDTDLIIFNNLVMYNRGRGLNLTIIGTWKIGCLCEN